MAEFEYIGRPYKGAGRPLCARTTELCDCLFRIKLLEPSNEARSYRVKLNDDEKGKNFYRFLQRTRSAAKQLDMTVSISNPNDNEYGIVTVYVNKEKLRPGKKKL